MKKRFLLLIAIIAVLMCILAISVSAASIVVDDVTYDLNSDGKTATVGNNKALNKTVVVIPQTISDGTKDYTVTSVSNGAFSNNDNIQTLVFPSTITVLSGYTFSQCDGLTSVYIDLDNLTSIGECGLTYNNSNRDSSLGSNVISFYAVSEYGKASPARTTSVNWANLTAIGAGSCQGLNIETIVIGDGLSSFPQQIFRNSKIVNFTLNSNVTTIGNWTFQGCTNLKKMTINSNNIQTIETTAFRNCENIEEFRIDLSHLKKIEGSAFYLTGSKNAVNNTTQWYDLNGEKLVDLSSLEQITGSYSFAGSNLGSADTIIWPRAYKANTLGGESDSGAFRRANIRGTVYFGVADGYTLNIDRWAFGNENYFDTVILGPNVTSADSAFTDITTLKNVVLLADTFDIKGSSFISSNASDVKLYYKKLTTNTNFSKSEEIQITSGTVINYGRCGVVCDVVLASDGSIVSVGKFKHVEGSTNVVDATCTTPAGTAHICKYCLGTIKIDETAPKLGHDHSILTSIVYTSYDKDGIKTQKCVRCVDTVESVADAIFTHVGYSHRESGKKQGIISEFSIDTTALTEYETFNNTTVTFGIVVFNPKYLGEGKVFNGTEINTTGATVSVEIDETARKYASLTCTIDGFDVTNSDHTSLELVIAGYAFEDGSDVQLMQRQYKAGEDTPCVHKVTREDATLLTVNIANVKTHVKFPESIKEFGDEE